MVVYYSSSIPINSTPGIPQGGSLAIPSVQHEILTVPSLRIKDLCIEISQL